MPKEPVSKVVPVVLPQKFIIEERLKEVEQLKFRNSDYEAKIATLQAESDKLQEQKAAITKAIEELRMGLKFHSTISSKVFFGQDAAKQSDDNLAMQVRMLEDELHRKKIQWSKLRHGNALTTDDISESRLRKTKCVKVAKLLEEEFQDEQARMEKVLMRSNAISRDIAYLEQKQDEIITKTETRGDEQKEEQDELLAKLQKLRAEIDEWEALDQKENIERAVMQSAGSGFATPTSLRSPRSMTPTVDHEAAMALEDAKEKEAAVGEQYEAFQKAFRALMRETGETDIRKIVDIFMQREEENYTIYNYLQRVEHSIQVEEQKLAQVTRDTQQYMSQAEGSVEHESSTYKKQLRYRDELVQNVRDVNKERKSLQRTQRRWHSAIEQFLCVLFGSSFEYQSELLRQTSGVSELILDLKNLLRTKTMFGSSSSQSNNLPAVTSPAILITEANALLGFAVIEQTVAEIMPAFIDAMKSRDLNKVIRDAAMNKYGTLAPAVARRPTALELNNENGANRRGRGSAQYDVVAPDFADVNPEGESVGKGHSHDGDGSRKNGAAQAPDDGESEWAQSDKARRNRLKSARRHSARDRLLSAPQSQSLPGG